MSLEPEEPGFEAARSLRVALIHHWLITMRGGERVVEALCQLFPKADLFTLVCDADRISSHLARRSIKTSWIQHLPLARRRHSWYLPFFPTALKSFELSGYDLVISSDVGFSKGVSVPAGVCHLCYCHTPMRYVWSGYQTYFNSLGSIWQRQIFASVAHSLRQWDLAAARQVSEFAANSKNVARRIRQYYQRDSRVIYPPVRLSDFLLAERAGDFYLAAGQLVPYKRFDLAVKAFNRLGRPLIVAGDGPELNRLRSLAGPTIQFVGRVSDDSLRRYLSECQALIFPGEEDFGIIAVEAHASGRPVIALAKGGALETVIPGLNGVFFEEESVESLAEAVERFERIRETFRPDVLRGTARRFSQDRFRRAVMQWVTAALGVRTKAASSSSCRRLPQAPDPGKSTREFLPVERSSATLGCGNGPLESLRRSRIAPLPND
ncbi:MAG: glycosyltransferase [Acidobacteriota bacterium]